MAEVSIAVARVGNATVEENLAVVRSLGSDQVDRPVRLEPIPFVLGQQLHRHVSDPVMGGVRRVVAFLKQVGPGVPGLTIVPLPRHQRREQG